MKLELNNMRLCKYRNPKENDPEETDPKLFLIFAYELQENVLIGCDIINLSEVTATKTMKLTLGKYKIDEIMEVPGNICHMLDESHPDFNENIMTTVGYFMSEGFDFLPTWGNIQFSKERKKQ